MRRNAGTTPCRPRFNRTDSSGTIGCRDRGRHSTCRPLGGCTFESSSIVGFRVEPFSITCTTCQARLRVRDASAIGQILGCPKCGSMVMVQPPPGYEVPPPQNRTPQNRTPRSATPPSATPQELVPAKTPDSATPDPSVPLPDAETTRPPCSSLRNSLSRTLTVSIFLSISSSRLPSCFSIF